MRTTHPAAAVLLYFLFLATLPLPTSSLPVLSFSFSSLTCNSPSNSSICPTCPSSLLLTYPAPTTNTSCTAIPSFPDSSLYYSYLSTTHTQGNLTLYRLPLLSPSTNSSSSTCSPSTLLASLPISTVIQCSNSSASTLTFNLTGGSSFTSTLLANSSSNTSSPFPYATATTCTSNCSSSLTCPAFNASTSPSSSSSSSSLYSFTANITLTSFCPSSCNPTYLTAFVGWQSQCLVLAGNDSRLQCGCYGSGYLGDLMSNCFISDASSQLLFDTAQSTFTLCSSYWQRPSLSSSSSSSTGVAASSFGSASSSINYGAIVGGVLGGAVGLILLILILRCCMRLQAKGHNIEIHRRPKATQQLQQQLEMEGKQLQAERDGERGEDDEEDDEDDDGEDDEEEGEDDEDGQEMEDDDVERQAQPTSKGGTPPRK